MNDSILIKKLLFNLFHLIFIVEDVLPKFYIFKIFFSIVNIIYNI